MKLLRHRHRSSASAIVTKPIVRSRPRFLSASCIYPQQLKGVIQNPRRISSIESVTPKQRKPAEKYCVLQILWSLFVIFFLISVCLGATVGVQWRYTLTFSDSASMHLTTEVPFLTETSSTHEPFMLSGSHHLYRRHEWGAMNDVIAEPLLHPSPIAVISHTVQYSCNSLESCIPVMQHMNISCNFLVSSDGSVFEGRGWDHQSELHIPQVALSICLIGNYNKAKLKYAQEDAVQQLLTAGVEMGKIHPKYKIVAQGQIDGTSYTSTTGKNAMASICKWPHYDSDFRVPI